MDEPWTETSAGVFEPVPVATGERHRLSVDLTLRDIGETLREVEAVEGRIVARRLAAALDYDRLVTLCRRWRRDPQDTDDDPNRWVHPRFMLLPFMDDALIPLDAREGLFPGDGAGPVRELARALAEAGAPCEDVAVFDEGVLAAWRAWRARQPAPPSPPWPAAREAREVLHEVAAGETVASIAARWDIADWADLWAHEREALEAFVTPDLLRPRDAEGRQVVLRIPDDRDHALARRLLAARGFDLEALRGGASWLDPRGVVSITPVDDAGRPLPDGTRVVVRTGDRRLAAVVKGGHVALRLPRGRYTVEVQPAVDDPLLAEFREAEGGDAVARASWLTSAIEAAQAARPRREPPPDVTTARAAPLEPVDFRPAAEARPPAPTVVTPDDDGDDDALAGELAVRPLRGEAGWR